MRLSKGIGKCMDLTSEQLNWMLDHYYNPVKIHGYLGVLLPVHCQLWALELITVEHFPGTILLTPTKLGHQVTAHQAPIAVLHRWGLRLSTAFLETHVVPYITLAELPELLVSSQAQWRAWASVVCKRLGGEG